MMFKRVLLLTVLMAVIVAPGTAYDYSETIEHFAYGDALGTATGHHSDNSGFVTSSCFYIWNAENCQYMRMIRSHAPLGNKINVPEEPQSFPVEFRRGVSLGVPGTTVIGKGTYGTFRSDGIGYVWVTFDEWNISAYTGSLRVDLVKTGGTGSFAKFKSHTWDEGSSYFEWNDLYHRVNWKDYEGFKGYPEWTTEVYYTEEFKNTYTVDEKDGIYSFALDRTHDGKSYLSYLYLNIGGTVLSPGTTAYSTDVFFSSPGAPVVVGVKPSVGDNWFNKTYYQEPSTQPTPVQPVIRTGAVTMTDHNGTTITGFNVTAVNAYTGQEYTVSTETDVAVMTLPMDRTIRLRNPQTGEYEDAPVGYYKFYGHKTGYKMLNEDGIKVSVMPEKYGSYQLCIILVTPESGPLSGKHKFQIRSRTDNSILQTGTISAKSATTGEWYNTTVSGGLATLILPYDTSNTQSQYAGNYYVYATSPGYQENDYGTQIVVMPHTVSEINTILLTPIGGIPPAGNVTLRIQAFSEYGPGVANASIFIAGVLGAGSDVWNTYTASSTGYLAVSVPGNSTYDIVASAEGYYDSARRIEVFTEAPGLIEMKLYLSGAPTVEPTTQPTGWPTTQPTTQPTGGIPDEDDDSEGFLMQAVRGIGLAFGVGFATAKLIFGMLLALSIGYATAKQLRGGAAEFGLGLLGGTLLGVLIGLLPVWIIVVLLLVVGLYIGNRYVGGANNG